MMKHLFIEIKALVRMWLFEVRSWRVAGNADECGKRYRPRHSIHPAGPRVSNTPIPGTTLFDGSQARKELCPQQDVLLLQLGGVP